MRPKRYRSAALVGLSLLLLPQVELCARDKTVDIEFFENRIRPVLIEYCFECHSAASKAPKAGLRLDSREAVRQGGDSGPAVVPGDIDASLLIDALKHESLEMPPGKKLPPEVVADFVKWVELGAPDPRDAPPSADEAAGLAWKVIFAKRRSWWSLLPLRSVSPPAIDGAAADVHAIDRFLLEKLGTAGLAPAPRAEPHALLRRFCFVMTGLPPTAGQIARYSTRLEDEPAQATAELLDELLASPHFGEHFARHWMDVVRYGDTYGYEWDPPAKGAWQYRDYLIRAFNDDIGFDQLVREQLAGDLLPAPRINPTEQIDESLVGPMFFHMGEHRHGNSIQFNGIHQEMVNNKIDAFSKAFLATTVACARCHDHKLDAVSQRDYFALASMFLTPRWEVRAVDAPGRFDDKAAQLKELRQSIREELATQWSAQAKEFANELAAAFAHSPPLQGGECARLDPWRKAFAETKSEKPPTLDDVAQMGAFARSMLADEASLSKVWDETAAEWRRRQTEALEFNASTFQTLADFRTPELPVGWVGDGDGMRHGYVDEGTPLVSLEGPAVVQRVLPRGYDTHALSPKLAGALRSPRLQLLEKANVSLAVAGGDWAATRTVPINAFLSGNPEFLESPASIWKRVSSSRNLKRDDWATWFELATASLNSNFPGIEPNLRKKKFDQRADMEAFNGWFSLTGIVAHDKPEAPKDPLHHWQELFAQPAPESAAAAWSGVGKWLSGAVERWCRGEPREGDTPLVNWLLVAGLLHNESGDTGRLPELVAQYRAIERAIALPRTVISMDERGMVATPCRLDVRGNVDEPGDPVAHDFLEVFAGQNDVAESPGSGRLALAEFLVSRKNPLTARVYVNRVWQWVFGAGLVSTPDDFGHLGDKPSHPALLDWLASEFMAHGWSTKWLVRQLVLSSAFQQQCLTTEQALQVDPDNRLLHHYPSRRLEAESVRDGILAVSGRLDLQLYGPPIDPPRNSEDSTKRLFSGPLDGNGRRSIYTKITLMEPPKFLSSFNFPDPKIPTGKRDVTNVPSQALALLNSPFVMAQAEFWAQRLIQEPQHSPAERLRTMFLRALGREPTVEELERWCLAVEDFRARQGIAEAQVMASSDIWTQIAHALFNTKEFIYYR